MLLVAVADEDLPVFGDLPLLDGLSEGKILDAVGPPVGVKGGPMLSVLSQRDLFRVLGASHHELQRWLVDPGDGHIWSLGDDHRHRHLVDGKGQESLPPP